MYGELTRETPYCHIPAYILLSYFLILGHFIIIIYTLHFMIDIVYTVCFVCPVCSVCLYFSLYFCFHSYFVYIFYCICCYNKGIKNVLFIKNIRINKVVFYLSSATAMPNSRYQSTSNMSSM